VIISWDEWRERIVRDAAETENAEREAAQTETEQSD
jgi:hypothetical protein